ncbi:MAG: hypothetical protein WAX29_09185 [Propionibacterium sp.]
MSTTTGGGTFESILFPAQAVPAEPASRESLHDLALDVLCAPHGEDPSRAGRALCTPLGDVETVRYRQEIFRALKFPALRELVGSFVSAVQTSIRTDEQARHSSYPYQAELHRLRGLSAYVMAVDELGTALGPALGSSGVTSRGWSGLVQYVDALRSSPAFANLRTSCTQVWAGISAIRYNLLVRGPKVSVGPVDDELDLETRVVSVFERFQQGGQARHCVTPEQPGLEHVQGWILALVAKVRPEPFEALVQLVARTAHYRDQGLEEFVSDMGFYEACLRVLDPLEAAGLPVCFPEVTTRTDRFSVRDGWDLALAARLVPAGESVTTNDLSLDSPERILVISGPNQGGKTTTARMFGQIHHLAAIGSPVPGRSAHVMLCDRVFTLFEREESLEDPQGRLGSELRRVHEVIEAMTNHSVVVMNEAFASTTWADSEVLTREILQRIRARGSLAVCVTFIDELSRLNEATVSMVSSVDPADPSVRTHRVVRSRADGRAYARSLARKHGLLIDQVRADVQRSTADPTPRRAEG